MLIPASRIDSGHEVFLDPVFGSIVTIPPRQSGAATVWKAKITTQLQHGSEFNTLNRNYIVICCNTEEINSPGR